MRSDREKLLDILEATDRIERYIVFGRERFERDELVQTWFVQNLQIIGEACRSLSQNTRDLAPAIPWKQIIGMRNILAHTYFDIDFDIVWTAISVNIPELRPQINQLLRAIESR
jgi:uncharacterized protein with HEPN domain